MVPNDVVGHLHDSRHCPLRSSHSHTKLAKGAHDVHGQIEQIVTPWSRCCISGALRSESLRNHVSNNGISTAQPASISPGPSRLCVSKTDGSVRPLKLQPVTQRPWFQGSCSPAAVPLACFTSQSTPSEEWSLGSVRCRSSAARGPTLERRAACQSVRFWCERQNGHQIRRSVGALGAMIGWRAQMRGYGHRHPL